MATDKYFTMDNKGQASIGAILFVALIIFILLGNQLIELNIVAVSIDNDKIKDAKHIITPAKRFDKWFYSYDKGQYDIIIKTCKKETIMEFPNVGAGEVGLIIPPENVPDQCMFIELYKFGVKQDEKQIFTE